jgi:hypothetical protein
VATIAKEFDTMSKKKTIVEQYELISKMLNGEAVEDYTVEQATAFLAERSAKTAKKNASGTGTDRKPTKTQVENEGIKAQILDVMGKAEGRMTVGELMKELAIESNQKVTSLLTQLRKDNKVVRAEEKGVAYYSLPSAEVEETED